MTREHAELVLSPLYEEAAWAEFQRAHAAGESEFTIDILRFLERQRAAANAVLAPDFWANPAPHGRRCTKGRERKGEHGGRFRRCILQGGHRTLCVYEDP